ncbi:MAG: DUF1003 domain-containing protein [Candidatus Pacebacteria bacterium]|nr:DUF1003 domain-containing protein [Candidatus Paceibacterota bacterium]MCD8563922.1 DUF1003 domain-containing protein [Candidatus Paceibacterota bacterium]
MKNHTSFISGKEIEKGNEISLHVVRPAILDLIKQEHPHATEDDFISRNELSEYRKKQITHYLAKELPTLSSLEQEVIQSIVNEKPISENIDLEYQEEITLGQRIADRVASFGGSWTFIISFGIFLAIWIILNMVLLSQKSFDPYPFILLNLILSTLAALQAPVIMMSQNRQEEKDRERAEKDYVVNLKAELEIRALHEKIDHLMIKQQRELFEIQKIQIELMNEILEKDSSRLKNASPF